MLDKLLGVVILATLLAIASFAIGYGFGFGLEFGFQHAIAGKALG